MKKCKNKNFNKDYKLKYDKSKCKPFVEALILQKQDNSNSHSYSCVNDEANQKHQEHFIILFPNTIIQEYAVVIETINASLTSAAVMGRL